MKFEYAGVDVSAATLEVRCSLHDGVARSFPNTAAGHKALIGWVRPRGKGACRVVMEPTGLYSLDLALALAAADRVEVMVVNPRRMRNFTKARGQRGKTDAMDASSLLEFARSMPFEPWTPPSEAALKLRQLVRYIDAIVTDRTRVKNQLHAAEATGLTLPSVLEDLRSRIADMTTRIKKLRADALAMVQADPGLAQRHRLLCTIPGIAAIAALSILSELVVMPAGMTPRQWVAHAGLDPRPHESGTSIRGQRRVSRQGNRNLRHALYMPAVVASSHSPHVAAYCERLCSRGKPKKLAVIAVMRKLLHAIFGMFRGGHEWDGTKFSSVTLDRVWFSH